MREIKYRVWCKNNNEWEKDQVAILPNGRILHFIKQFPSMVVKAETHIIQFYTGLRDKNGKEIYEGDIVRIKAEPPFTLNYTRNVMFVNGLFGIKSQTKNEICPISAYHLSIREVIGNIYDNPELLEGCEC